MITMCKTIGAKEDKPVVRLVDITVWLTVVAATIYGVYCLVGWLINVWIPG